MPPLYTTIPYNLEGKNTKDPNLSQTPYIYWNQYPRKSCILGDDFSEKLLELQHKLNNELTSHLAGC